jgi:hypothetical protein
MAAEITSAAIVACEAESKGEKDKGKDGGEEFAPLDEALL